MSKTILSDEELLEVTGRSQGAAQARILAEWRVPFKRRPDGSLVVSRAAFDAAISGATIGKPKAVNGLNWSTPA